VGLILCGPGDRTEALHTRQVVREPTDDQAIRNDKNLNSVKFKLMQNILQPVLITVTSKSAHVCECR